MKGFTSNCHPELVSGSSKIGFTLIELLVVVLIIGILAAVSLPQYQVAVAKSRMAAHLPILRSLQKAQELYYLANGTYAAGIRDLDIECQQYGTGVHSNWCYLNNGKAKLHLDEGRYFILEDSRVKNVRLLFFFLPKSSAACYAYDDDFAARVCKNLTGNPVSGGWDRVTTYLF